MKLSPTQAKLVCRLVQKGMLYANSFDYRSMKILAREGYAEEMLNNVFRPTTKAIAYLQNKESN